MTITTRAQMQRRRRRLIAAREQIKQARDLYRETGTFNHVPPAGEPTLFDEEEA